MRMHNPDYLESLFFRYIPKSATRDEIKELTAPLMRAETEIKSFSVRGACADVRVPDVHLELSACRG